MLIRILFIVIVDIFLQVCVLFCQYFFIGCLSLVLLKMVNYFLVIFEYVVGLNQLVLCDLSDFSFVKFIQDMFCFVYVIF